MGMWRWGEGGVCNCECKNFHYITLRSKSEQTKPLQWEVHGRSILARESNLGKCRNNCEIPTYKLLFWPIISLQCGKGVFHRKNNATFIIIIYRKILIFIGVHHIYKRTLHFIFYKCKPLPNKFKSFKEE